LDRFQERAKLRARLASGMLAVVRLRLSPSARRRMPPATRLRCACFPPTRNHACKKCRRFPRSERCASSTQLEWVVRAVEARHSSDQRGESAREHDVP
jgi:hypothetical protein